MGKGLAVTGWGRVLSAGSVEVQGLLMMLADGHLATRSLRAAAQLSLATADFGSPPGLLGVFLQNSPHIPSI